MTKEELKNPDFILGKLHSQLAHLAVIRNSIYKDAGIFLSYFREDMHLDEEFQDFPFLAYLCHQVFNWCGCGVGNGNRLKVLFHLMEMNDDRMNKKITYEEFNEKIKAIGGDNVYCVLMDFFGNKSLFSHGGSCYGAWLDYDGQFVYDCLKLFMAEFKDE